MSKIDLTFVDAAAFWTRVARGDGCWIWSGARQSQGYGTFQVGSRARRVARLAHRIAYLISRGDFDQSLHVLHRCDNPPCVNPDHLFLGTAKDNADDKSAKGRARGARGSSHRSAKLTSESVREIRRRVGNGETQKALAQEFGVSRASVWQIVHRVHWAHVLDGGAA